MDRVDVVLERGIATEGALAEAAGEGLQLHVDALRVVLEVGYGLEGLPALLVGALERAVPVGVRQEMVLEMLLLFESLVAAFERARELSLMALEVPIELALRDELAVEADGTLEL